MSNTVYNKVTVNGTTYIDLSQDTVSDASHIKYGYTGHLNDGTQVTGTLASGGVIISDTLDENGGTIRTITTVETPVSLQTKSNITPGVSSVTVTPDTGYDGMTSVQVNGDANLVAANIKSGVTIFGVTGTHEGSSGSGSGSGSGITQDQDGYIVLPSNGSESGSGSSNNNTIWETIYNNSLYLGLTDDGTYYYATVSYTGEIELDSVWKITWNGTSYICTATSTGDPVGIPYAIGNSTIINEQGGNNEPFFIQRIFADNQLYVFTAQEQTINIKIEKQISPTQHTIHFEFSDSTETDINLYYNDAFISSLITSTTPTLYGQKTVFIAALDNVTWYDANAIPIGVELIDYTKCTQDYAIDSDGTVYAEQWYCVSDYTPIMPGQTYSYTGIYWFNIAFYDSTKTLISALSMYQDGTQDTENTNVCHGTLSGNKIPSNAAYVRITGGYNASNEDLSLIRTA